jgi:hypothetical protein
MAFMTNAKVPIIRRGRTEIGLEKTTFVGPEASIAYGPNTYL